MSEGAVLGVGLETDIPPINFHPHEGRLLAVQIEPPSQVGGIIIPDNVRHRMQEGLEYVIWDLGVGDWDEDLRKHIPFRGLQAGQHIMIAKYVGVEVSFRRTDTGESVGGVVIKPEEIVGVID